MKIEDIIDVLRQSPAMKTTAEQESLFQQMLAAIVQSSQDAIISYTVESNISSWNPAAEKLFGYQANEIVGQPLFKIISPDLYNHYFDILARVSNHQSVEPFQSSIIHKNGGKVNVSISISALRKPSGTLLGLSLIARSIVSSDIVFQNDKRVVHEPGFSDTSSERLKMAIEATGLGTWDFQPKSGKLFWSNECRRIYDIPKDVEVDFKLFQEHLHPEDAAIATNAIAQAMDPNGTGTYDVQYRILRYSDKKPRWIRAQGKVYFDTDKQPELFIGTVLDVTSEKSKVQKLEDSIFLFQRLADTVPVMIWTTRKDGYCDYVNELWCSYTGQSMEEALGFGWLEVLHPDDREKAGEAFKEANKNHTSFTSIYRLKNFSGSYKWFMNTGKPRIDSAGQPEGFTGAIIEIDEHKKAEEALFDSERRLNLALDTANMGTWEINFKTKQTLHSNRYLEILGYAPDQLPSHQDVIAQIYPDDLPVREAAMANAFATGLLDYEMRIVRKDNQLRWIKAKGKVLYDKNGEPEKMQGSIIDITDQKKAFEELQLSESRLTKLADAMPQLVWIAEPDGKVVYYNNRISEYGAEPKEAGDIWSWQPLVHPDETEKTLEAWYDAVSNRKAYSHEHRILMKDGSYRWHLSRAFPDKDGNGNILRWFGTATDINDIKKIQQSKEESEERLRFALDASKMGAWSIDLATGKAITSQRHREIMGYDETNDLTRDKYLKYLHPEDRVQLDTLFYKAILDGAYQFEGRVLIPGKPLKWIKIHGKTIYDEIGVARTVLGTVVDITEEKNVAVAILESEERFRIIANTAPVMIWMSGNDRFSDFFNTRWLNFTGRTLEEESKEGWQANVHPDDIADCVKVYEEAYKLQQPFSCEYRLKRHDGVYRWIMDNAVPRFAHDGSFIGFVSACMDIDEEKQYNEKLQASELMFKTITNVSPVGLWMTDEHGNNNFVNDTWVNWTGLKLSDQYNIGWIQPVVEEDREMMFNLFLERMAVKEKYTAEFRFLTKEGQLRWGLTEGFPYYDDNGNFGGYAGSVTDITDRKKDELLKNDFLAVASHELKTPLTSIKAYSQLLSKAYQKASDAFLKNGLVKIENQVNKMTKLVGDFLNLSKLESEKFRLDNEEFDINELVREIATDIQMLAINHTLLLDKGEPIKVIADKEKISQVVTNLLNNAVKYSPVDKSIRVSLVKDENWVTVSIIDKGIGVKPGEHEKIFQRFYRSEFTNNISFSGFGIGLYISAEIIKRHGGRIGVNSEEGKGSEFYFKLPVLT